MSYLLIEILACLLLAGLIGAVIGWLLRGGCNKKISDCEEECRMKLNSLESSYNNTEEIDDYQMKFESEATKVNKTYQEINDINPETTSLKSENNLKEQHFIEDETTPIVGFNKPKEKIKIPTLGNISIDDINIGKPIKDQDNKLDIDLETPEISKVNLHDIDLNKKEEDISISLVNPDIELKSPKIQQKRDDDIKLDIPNISDDKDDIKLNIPNISENKKDIKQNILNTSKEKIRDGKDIKLNIPNLSMNEKDESPTGFILGNNEEEKKISQPKKEETPSSDNLQSSYDIQEIEGIGPAYGRKLRSMGVDTTLDLIELFKKNNHRIDRAAQDMRVKPEAITAWISMADLMRLPGVDSQCAELLQTIGISSVIELSITNAHSIHNEMLKLNQKYPVCPEVPSAETITAWIISAKSL